jgi:hypothetical protein
MLGVAMVAMLVLQLIAIAPRQAAANQLSFFQVIKGAQVAQASYGGMRATGTGTIFLSGVTGAVRSAYLYWHGRTNSTDPAVNAAAAFGGVAITGTNIGVSSDNSWSFLNSQAYRADVTSIVRGARFVENSASFALTGFRKLNDAGGIVADTNGASLLVFYDDAAKAPHDYLLWSGNDSNFTNPNDPQGWDVRFSGITYTGGAARLTLHVGDGQDFADGALLVNGAVLVPAGGNFQGDTAPFATRENGSSPGSLWDVHGYDVSSFLANRSLNLTYDTTTLSTDYLSLVAALLEVPAGGASGTGAITITAEPASQFVGQQVVLTATALNGTIAAPVETTIILTSSLSDGTLANLSADRSGRATFSYTRADPVTETVTATFTDVYGIQRSASTIVTWAAANQAVGIAQCFTQKLAPAKNPGTITTTVLPNATLTFTPALGTPIAADATGAFAITGLAASTAYRLQYAATVKTPALGDRVVSCHTAFTTNATGGAIVPPSQPVPNYGNHTWLHPFTLNEGVSDVLTAPFQKTWYKVAVTPQQRVTVTLTGLTRNYTLTAYTDLSKLAAKIKNRAHTLKGVATIHAQGDISAGDLDSGDLDSGDLDSGDLDSGDLDSGDLDSGDLDSGDLDSGDLDSGDLDSGDLDSGDLDSGDLDSADVYGTTQRLGRRAFSAHAGLAPESITLNTRGYTGFVYYRVAGHSGAYDTGNTFQLTLSGIVPTDASCVGAPLTNVHFLGSAPATGATSLIVTNTARLGTALGSTTPAAIAGQEKIDFDAKLAALAARSEVKGAVVDLAGAPFAATFGPAFLEWDANAKCALEGNLIATAVHDLIDAYRAANPGLKYIVFAGGHQAVPFFSQVDRAEISREWRFSPPLDGTSAGEAALAGGYYLTDDYYATNAPIEKFGRAQLVPDLITGRLVETSADISASITSYLGRGGAIATTNGAAALPSLSAGYTFNRDAATAIAAELSAAGQTVDTTLNNDTWSAAQLRAKLLQPGAARYSVIGVQAHFSANRLVPADNLERVLSTEFLAGGSFDGSLIESIGCHLGFNIVDTYGIPTITRPRSFPEVLLGRGATLVANTGYGYADDVLLKSSEDLLVKFTHELRFSQDATGTPYAGGTPLGQALQYAKLQYLAQPNPRGIDEKVVGEATLYGLPMSTITLPTRLTRPSATALITTPVTGVDSLSSTTIDQGFSLVRSAIGPGGSSFYSVGGDLTKTLATPLRPIGPAQAIDVTAKETSAVGPDTLARGWVILEGDASIVPSFVPRISLPATEDSTPATATYINHAFTPTRPGALSTLSTPTFQFQPFQYLSNAAGNAGTARLYGREKVKLYFSRAIDSAALAEAPLVYNIALTNISAGAVNKAHIDVTAGYGFQAGIADLWITYTTDGGLTFRSALASLGTPAINAGSLATCGTKCGFVQHATADIDTGAQPATALQLFVQAVGNNALVTSATNSGQLYSLALQNTTNAPELTPTTVTGVTTPSTATYLSRISVSATLTSAGNPLPGKTVTFKLGRSRVTATTLANGVATASLLVNIAPSNGAHPVAVSFAGDATYAGSGAASGPVTVTPARTALLPAGPLQSGESGPVATLVLPDHANAPLVDQLVTIAPGDGQVATTYTNLHGTVRLDAGDLTGPLPSGFLDIRYPGDPGGRYAPSSTTLVAYDPTKAVAAGGSVTSGGLKGTFAFGLKYLSMPTVTPATGGSLGEGQYRIGHSFASSFGETALGATALVSVGPNGAISVAAITGIPSDKVSVKFYFTSAPAGRNTGLVITRPVNQGNMAAFTITAGPATSAAAVTAPTGALGLRIQNAATGATTATFVVLGTPGGFDWLVITGSPSSHAVFEGTGSYNTSSPFASVRRHFRVVVDKPANTFSITIDATGSLPAITISGTVTPLPLDDEPSSSGIVFR